MLLHAYAHTCVVLIHGKHRRSSLCEWYNVGAVRFGFALDVYGGERVVACTTIVYMSRECARMTVTTYQYTTHSIPTYRRYTNCTVNIMCDRSLHLLYCVLRPAPRSTSDVMTHLRATPIRASYTKLHYTELFADDMGVRTFAPRH